MFDQWAKRSGQDLVEMTRVEAILDAYPRQVAADLWRHYNGLDLRDLWRPRGGASRLTYRMLAWFIDGLPGESLTKTAIRDAIPDDELAAMAKRRSDGHGQWSHEALLQAAVLDVLRTILYFMVRSKGGKAQEPEPYPRPGVVSKRRRALSPEGHAYLMKLRAEHAELHGYDIEGQATETG